jgi:hypothetical protein
MSWVDWQRYWLVFYFVVRLFTAPHEGALRPLLVLDFRFILASGIRKSCYFLLW